jgi:hypothetical protein
MKSIEAIVLLKVQHKSSIQTNNMIIRMRVVEVMS